MPGESSTGTRRPTSRACRVCSSPWPPFGLFISEFALLRAGFAIGRPWLMGIVLALLTVACVGFVAHANRMLYGTPPAGVVRGKEDRWRLVPLALCMAALVTLGLFVPAPVASPLAQIVEIVGP